MAHLISPDRQHVRTVDFARGICATCVAAYHILYYEQIATLDIVAFYAVYAFFVISGFAMYVAYRDRIDSHQSLKTYFLRRFWRIAPLFYTATLIHLWLRPDDFSWANLVLNGLLVFGAANPGTTSIVTGGWSIGIEMVFYVVFPAVLAITARRIGWLAAMFVAAMAAQLTFINMLSTEGFSWVLYTQPVAFIGYFLAGCLLGEGYYQFRSLKGASWWLGVGVLALVPFAAADTATAVDLLIGWRGALLSCATIVLIAAIAFVPEPTGTLARIAEWFGRMSYPIYLIHPLAYIWVSENMTSVGSTIRILAAVSITVAISEAVNRAIERPAIRYSKRLA